MYQKLNMVSNIMVVMLGLLFCCFMQSSYCSTALIDEFVLKIFGQRSNSGSMNSDFLPQEYDSSVGWEECLGFSTIQDQGSCSSCCAMAVSSVLSARECMRDARNVLFSAQQIWDCTGEGNWGNCGVGVDFSSMINSMANSAMSSQILIPNSCSSYTAKDYNSSACGHSYGGCVDLSRSLQQTPLLPQADISTFLYSSVYANELGNGRGGGGVAISGKNGARALMAEIWINGPVVAVLKISSSDFHLFERLDKDAIFVPNASSLNLEPNSGLQHCVMVYGWGVDRKTGQNYWLIQNSYGKQWSNNGRGKIIRGYNWLEMEWRGLSTKQRSTCFSSLQNSDDVTNISKKLLLNDSCLSSAMFNNSIMMNKRQILLLPEVAEELMNLLTIEFHLETIYKDGRNTNEKVISQFSNMSNGEIWAITWACSLAVVILVLCVVYLIHKNRIFSTSVVDQRPMEGTSSLRYFNSLPMMSNEDYRLLLEHPYNSRDVLRQNLY